MLADSPWSVNRDISTVSFTESLARSSDLHPGWNIISNPFGVDVSWDQVQQANNLTVGLWDWSSTWQEVQNLTSATEGTAFYMRNRAGLDLLVIPYPVSNSAPTRSTADAAPRQLQLSLVKEEETSTPIRLGVGPGAAEGIDAFDRFAPPERFQRASLQLHSDSVDAPLAADVRPGPLDRGARYEFDLEAPAGEPVTLQAENLDAFAEHEVVLISQASATEYDLHRDAEVGVLPKTDSTRWVVLIGDESYVAEEKKSIVPETVQLRGNRPNPVRRTTTIEYALPEDQPVRLALYDVLGRRVQVLVDDRQRAGVHTVRWTADDVASGVYFYRLKTESDTKTRKIVVVR